ncbi:hypothetical protein HPB52_001361 [Rhipicephalus sanguineus]|uniref:Uncharacterized protein n=1 Tax=Rhipicephalus sanguineus TaxID=34632 RepID=A0A9D4T8E8_RHISA|nr:hypothetical protein HPB52_001361 [Rhipicephalus sanguineus]
MSLASPSDDAQAADDDNVGQGQDAATATAWTALEEAGIVPENVALSGRDADVYEELSDAEILKSARGAATAADSSDDEVVHGVPTVPTPDHRKDSQIIQLNEHFIECLAELIP